MSHEKAIPTQRSPRLARPATEGWIAHRALVWQATRPVGERLVELVDPQPGERLLELAAGSGDTGFLAARRVLPHGRLLATDVDPAVTAVLRRNAQQLRLANVEVRLADAQRTSLPTAAFDAVLFRFGLMLCERPDLALAESRRVLRPGGRLGIAVWADRRANPWGTAPLHVLDELRLRDPADPRAPGAFALDDPRRLGRLVRRAGLEIEHEECVRVVWRYRSFDAFWSTAQRTSRVLSSSLPHCTASERLAVRRRLRELLRPWEHGDGLALPGAAHVVLARSR